MSPPAGGPSSAPDGSPSPEDAGADVRPPPPQGEGGGLPEDHDAELGDEEPFRLATVTDTYQLYLGRQGGAWWGRTLGTLDASVSDLSALVSEPAHYGTVFPRFTRFASLQKDVFHAVLDLPDPMGQRGMVLRRSVEQQGSVATVRFSPAPEVSPPADSPTFLPDYEVNWRFEPVDGGVRAQVSWNTELAMPLPPSFAKHAVEARAGEEFAQLMAGTQCESCHTN